MTLVRWDPFRDLSTLQHRMNQIFDESMRRRETAPTASDDELMTGAWAPAVDVFETPEKIVLKAEVPGIPQDQLNLQVTDGVLTLKGERKFVKEAKGENFHRVERAYGQFARSFSLPPTVDAEKVVATYELGVLTIEIPKKEEKKPRQIQVKVGGGKE